MSDVKGPVMLARHIDLGNSIQSMDSAGRETTGEEIGQYTVWLSLNIEFM